MWNQDKQKFIAYEKIRKSGLYNMFDDRSRQLTGLSKEDYLYVIQNYSQLKSKYENK